MRARQGTDDASCDLPLLSTTIVHRWTAVLRIQGSAYVKSLRETSRS